MSTAGLVHKREDGPYPVVYDMSSGVFHNERVRQHGRTHSDGDLKACSTMKPIETLLMV